MITDKEVQLKVKQYIDDFLPDMNAPYASYLSFIGSCPIRNTQNLDSMLKRWRDNRMVNKKLPTRPIKSDNLDDWCILVGIKRRLPEKNNLPGEYQGVKVFYTAAGEIRYH